MMATPHRLPSLNALRAFEAVAQHLSFAKAAEDLHVTKAAVAQQVRLLEAEIGTPLVRRSGRGLSLTEAGQAGLRDLKEGFAKLAAGARRMRETRGRDLVVISAGASFAATWLVRRIGKFKQEHPEIDVLLDAARSATEMDRDGIDAYIVWGTGDFPGFISLRLFEEHVFPVCSPRLLGGERPLRDPADLRHHTLLHLEWDWHFGAWPDWETWLGAAGVADVDVSRGLWFNQMSIALEAAIEGQGVTLSTRALAADEIRLGRLAAPFATSVETPFGYYFVCRPDYLRNAKFVALRQWLIDEAARSQS
jgi:LysR family transcriptional regulator, glycine cleavage system transcriptional activator